MQPQQPTAADLFDLLWETLADVMGTAATAALLRRAIRRVASQRPAFNGVVIDREDLVYRCHVPDDWRQPGNREAMSALRTLAGELHPLLVELTGTVVVHRLEQVPGLWPPELDTCPD